MVPVTTKQSMLQCSFWFDSHGCFSPGATSILGASTEPWHHPDVFRLKGGCSPSFNAISQSIVESHLEAWRDFGWRYPWPTSQHLNINVSLFPLEKSFSEMHQRWIFKSWKSLVTQRWPWDGLSDRTLTSTADFNLMSRSGVSSCRMRLEASSEWTFGGPIENSSAMIFSGYTWWNGCQHGEKHELAANFTHLNQLLKPLSPFFPVGHPRGVEASANSKRNLPSMMSWKSLAVPELSLWLSCNKHGNKNWMVTVPHIHTYSMLILMGFQWDLNGILMGFYKHL